MLKRVLLILRYQDNSVCVSCIVDPLWFWRVKRLFFHFSTHRFQKNLCETHGLPQVKLTKIAESGTLISFLSHFCKWMKSAAQWIICIFPFKTFTPPHLPLKRLFIFLSWFIWWWIWTLLNAHSNTYNQESNVEIPKLKKKTNLVWSANISQNQMWRDTILEGILVLLTLWRSSKASHFFVQKLSCTSEDQ